MNASWTLARLNALEQAEFASALGAIFEHSPWVAERTWPKLPFASVGALHSAMCKTLADADETDQLCLIRAHPQLASKAAVRGELTAASNSEQGSAGLLECSADEFKLLSELNDQYQQRFDFPFILAVRGHTRASIIDNLRKRIGNQRAVELAEALLQIERIAKLRLDDLFTDR